MPTITPKLGLNKPANNEAYNISKVTNENADILDEKVLINPILNKEIPIDTDSIVLIDSEDTNKSKKFSWLNIKSYLQEKLISGTNIKTINGNPILGSGDLVIATSSDWNAITATLTYASADSPTFVANTSIDLTSLISVGMKLKLTQTTVKYFIVTAITSTTITLYGGTDYTLTNSTITLPFVSSMKAPIGFPLDKNKWTVIFKEGTTSFSQANPTQNTWYNMYSLAIPIGLWEVEWSAIIAAISNSSKTGVRVSGTLSTTNNGETNTNLSAYQGADGASGTIIVLASVNRKDNISITSKTTYYLNIRTVSPTGDVQTLTNSVNNQPTIIKAVCAYL